MKNAIFMRIRQYFQKCKQDFSSIVMRYFWLEHSALKIDWASVKDYFGSEKENLSSIFSKMYLNQWRRSGRETN